ncbi:hypothetical protein GC167_03325 [bacterium]|nr:hypothetical protein [bacterium]
MLYRKITFVKITFVWAALLFWGCQKNNPQFVDTTYPLDDMPPEPKFNPLVAVSGGNYHYRMAIGEEERIRAEYLHPEALLVNHYGFGPMQSDPVSDLLLVYPVGDQNQDPLAYAAGQRVPCTQLSAVLDTLQQRAPVLGVSHAIQDLGPEYQVDLRIDFFQNHSSPRLYAQTYLLIDGLKARNILEWLPDGEFRQLSTLPQLEDNYVFNQTGTSKWKEPRAFIGTAPLIKKDEPYYHRNVFMKQGLNPQGYELNLGQNLTEFSQQSDFSTGTRMGTWRKPLRFLLPKPLVDPILDVEGFSVLSVVWEVRYTLTDTLYIPLNATRSPVAL